MDTLLGFPESSDRSDSILCRRCGCCGGGVGDVSVV